MDGLEGVTYTYQNALNNSKLHGPTYFSKILKEVKNMVESVKVSQDSQKFFILVIITDGLINDMQKTIDEIVRGSGLPLAVIIVGVGDADFSGMDTLDADEEALYSTVYRKY